MTLRINPTIDPSAFAETYAHDGLVQIPGIFDEQTGDAILNIVSSLPWRFICQDDTKNNLLLSSAQLKAMSPAERAHLEAGIRRRAAENFGYAYLTYPMIQAGLAGMDRDHPIHAVTLFLNSPPFLEFARAVTGCAGILKTDAQASNYRPGNFLTRHIDDGQRKERRAAYTIGLTRRWEPDWGGLLTFLDHKLDVSRALLPRFNVLTIFNGLRVHSVSPVSAFAPVERLSIVGWFRDDAPAWFSRMDAQSGRE